ncbi:heavy metal-binding domain-containing protein [Paenibacillus alkalitolerans]
MIITTTNTIEGSKITDYLGIVSGEAVTILGLIIIA